MATPTSPSCPVMAALDACTQPACLFIRDDDAGWDDDALLALLDSTHRAQAPIDLAVIPQALGPALARQLRQLPARVGLHQHGSSHANHEPEGQRKCELGAARSPSQQRADLITGRDRLRQLLDGRLDDGFTPPWNRIAAHTPALLAELGYAWLSRDAGGSRAAPQQLLPELPVHTDFSRHWAHGPDAVALHLAGQIRLRPHAAIGLMLHHAVMDAAQRQWLDQALQRWCAHPMARWVRMADAVQNPALALADKATAAARPAP